MKKRILSLILALSMVLSVLPLGAFAADPPELVMKDGLPDCSNGTTGNGWSYDSSTQTLILKGKNREFDFSLANPQDTTNKTPADSAVKCAIESGAKITGGTFEGSVKNHWYITDGIFYGTVTNLREWFDGYLDAGTIQGGTFNGNVDNTVNAAIENGTFEKEVTNSAGVISGGTFKGDVINNNRGDIKGGTFNKKVTNNAGGEISGGTFAGSVENKWNIYGGVFNGKTGLDGVTGVHSITWDAASPKAKITEVNGVSLNGSADWKPYVVVTEWTPAKTKVVTITADTDIYSLNGQPIVDGNCNSSYPDTSKKTIVKFTMPNRNVELGTGELVMENGYPVGTSGKGWSYDSSTKTLTLTYGTFDFNSTHPQGKTPGTSTTTPVACAIQSYATITGGIFAGSVTNGGTIENGTFNGTVTNNGTISGGAFTGQVDNKFKINGGTFRGEVTNSDTITGNSTTFEKLVTNNGYIYNGTFRGEVTNNGTITGNSTTFEKLVTNGGTINNGTFAAGLSRNDGSVTGGVFNGKTGLTTKAHQVTVTNGSVSQVNGVDPRNADGTTGTAWDLYAYKGTTVIITADTEIFSLNGYPISGAYNSSYPYTNNKKIVKFTMPYNENVVLSTGELVMAGGYPIGSNNGANNYNGKGWAYSAGNLSDPTDTGTLHLWSGTFDFNFADPTTKITRTDSAVACAIQSSATITGGIFEKKVTNNAGGTIYGGTFKGTVLNGSGVIFGGTFAAGLSEEQGIIFGGVFNGKTGLANDALRVTVTNGSVLKVNGEDPLNADETTGTVTPGTAWDLYAYAGTTVTITASTEIFSLNGQPIGTGNCNSSYGSDKKTVTFTMPDDDVVLNGAITSTDLVMENGYPKDSNGGKNPCKGDGWEYIPNDPTNGDMLLLTGSNQTGGLFDFSTIGDGAAVECNVFVGKPTAITGGEFNGKVFNNSGILGGTFHGEVDNMGPGRIVNGTFKNSVENNGMIENGTFHDEVKNNGTINDGAFNGKVENNSVINSGTFHDEVVNTTMGRIENGTFNDAVENNGTIENGTFHDAVKNNGIINGGTFNGAVENNGTINGGVFNGAVTGSGTVSGNITGSGTLNGEPITKTPEPEPKPEPEPTPEPKPEPQPEPEPTTYTVTVIGGTIDGKTSVSAKENDTLTVVLDQNDIPDGMTFDLWSISSDKLSGDINVDYRAEAMTFQMPAEDVTIRAQYRSAEIIEDAAPSPLATAATIAVGGAAAGIVVWQGVSLGVDLYLANALPQGVPVPTDRRALALLLWETAGKPEVALPTLYGDIPTEEIELQKATRWAVQNGLMDAADKKDASFFDPDHYVTKMDVFGAWLRLKKLLGTT